MDTKLLAYGIVAMVVVAGLYILTDTVLLNKPTPDEIPVEEEFYPHVVCDPECNQPMQDSEWPANEPHIAINPLDPLNVVGASNDYDTILGDTWLGAYSSKDGGKTWKSSFVPRDGLNDFKAAGDPVLAVDGEGNFYLAGIVFQRAPVKLARNSAIVVSKSTDGGETWGRGAILVQSILNINFHDKEWIIADQNNGNLYTCWTMFTENRISSMLFSRSTDGGTTWNTVPTIISEIREKELQVQGCAVSVGPHGEVFVNWIDFIEMQLRFVVSTDEGQTFSDVKNIGLVDETERYLPENTYRTPTLPAMAVDLTDGEYNGSIYVTWNDDRNGDVDIMLIYSRDGGDTWSDLVRVNNDTLQNGLDQFFPAIAISPQGWVHLAFYDKRNDENNSLLEVYYAMSKDGGQNFTYNFNVTDVQFDGEAGGGSLIGQITQSTEAFIGDYIGIAVTEDTANIIWCDMRNGEPDDKNSDIYGARIRFAP